MDERQIMEILTQEESRDVLDASRLGRLVTVIAGEPASSSGATTRA